MGKQKRKRNRLYLMVQDVNDIMKDFVWATIDELDKLRAQGYKRLNKN